jgi:hypothetical protein
MSEKDKELKKLKHTSKDQEPKYEPSQRLIDEVKKRFEERYKDLPPPKKSGE